MKSSTSTSALGATLEGILTRESIGATRSRDESQDFELRRTPRGRAATLQRPPLALRKSSSIDDTNRARPFATPTTQSAYQSREASPAATTHLLRSYADDDDAYAEGGYGWVIVLCTFVLIFHSVGQLYAWGVIQTELQKQGVGSPVALSWVGGIYAGLQAAFMAPGSFLLHKLGDRYTCMLASIVMALSCTIISFLTTHLPAIFVFVAGVNAMCTGLLFISSYTLPSQHFKRRRGLATGITCAVWSIVLQKVIASFGVPWAYRVSAISTLLTCVPAAYFLRPGVPPPSKTDLSGAAISQPSIFKNRLFLLLVASCFVVSFPFFIPAFFLPLYAESLGLTASTGALLSAAFNIASGVGRIGFGLLADTLLGYTQSLVVALLCVALSSLLLWPFALNSSAVAGFAIWCGLGSGGFFALQSPLVGQILGSHRVPQAIGAIELISSAGFLMGPIAAGLLLEAFGGLAGGPDAFKPAMYITGGATFLAAMLAAIVRLGLERKLWAKV